MDTRQLMTQLPGDLSGLSPVLLDMYRADTRRFAVWNRRAALLRARDAGADAEVTAFIDETIHQLENAFQNTAWVRFGDAVAGLDPITPLPSADEVARLAKANNAAAQTVAKIAFAGELLDVAVTFLDIANGRIGADGIGAALADDEAVYASPASASRPIQHASKSGVAFAAGMVGGAVLGALLIMKLVRSEQDR